MEKNNNTSRSKNKNIGKSKSRSKNENENEKNNDSINSSDNRRDSINDNNYMVITDNLLKKYNGHPAVDGVSLHIPAGASYGLLGPNGAGKSTTISMLSGLLTPDRGDVIIGGHSILAAPLKAKALLGVVPQEIALYPNLSARDNLMFWGRMYSLQGSVLRRRVEEVLELVEMGDRAGEPVENYSGGMKRRVNIAAGLLHQPRLLLLDEPTVGVDPQSRRSILDTIRKLNKEGLTVLYTSHYMEEVEEMCDLITIMDHGKIIAEGTNDELRKMVADTDIISLQTGGILPGTVFVQHIIDKIPGVKTVNVENSTILITLKNGSRQLAGIISAATEQGIRIEGVKVEEPNLETVFLHLTGRGLRDKM